MAISLDPIVEAALIAAISAISVAIINYFGLIKTKTQIDYKKKSKGKKINENERYWIKSMFIFIPWLIISIYFQQSIMGFINELITIPIVMGLLAFFKPIQLGNLIFTVLSLLSFNYYLIGLSNELVGTIPGYRAGFLEIFESGLLFLIAIILFNILFALLIYYIRKGKS